jgi:aspartate carbamoyltransferase catalytic subunit
MIFKGKDIISIKDFSKKEINYILDYAEEMIPDAKG